METENKLKNLIESAYQQLLLRLKNITSVQELFNDRLTKLENKPAVSPIGDLKLKSLEYTGNGNATHSITFPSKPYIILNLGPIETNNRAYINMMPITWGAPFALLQYTFSNSGTPASDQCGILGCAISYSGNTMTFTGRDPGYSGNENGVKYKCVYL